MSTAKSNSTSTAAVTLSGVGIALTVVFLATTGGGFALNLAGMLGLAGLILGIVAAKREGKSGRATTAIVLGSIAFLLWAGLWIFALIFVGAIG